MSLIDFESLSEPAKVFVERVSDLIGGALRPSQTHALASGELKTDTDITATVAWLEAESLRRRTAKRFIEEEEAKQRNMEAITAAAVPQIKADARPDKVERDWYVNFFDRARLTSDAEMQQLWTKILAGEANAPGKFSKRTVNLMASLDKSDAELFQLLCRFNWQGLAPTSQPIIFDTEADIYTSNGFNFSAAQHLSEIGLASFEALTGYSISFAPNPSKVPWYSSLDIASYGGRQLAILPQKNRTLNAGKVMFSRSGADLASICAPEPVEGFFDYCVKMWSTDGAKIKEMKLNEPLLPGDFGL